MLIILMFFCRFSWWLRLYRAQQKLRLATFFIQWKAQHFSQSCHLLHLKVCRPSFFSNDLQMWLYVVNSVYLKRIFRPVSMIKTRTSSIHFSADAKLYNNHILFLMLCSMVCFFTYYFSLRSTHICRSAVQNTFGCDCIFRKKKTKLENCQFQFIEVKYN